MYGFERAQAEYERHLQCPYDEGGALYDWEEAANEREEIAIKQAEMMMDAIWSD